MRPLSVALAAVLCLCCSTAFAQGLREHVEFLSSESCGGRDIGTPGHDEARDYIARMMERAGLLPAGTRGWFVPVRVVRDVIPSEEASLQVGTSVLAQDIEFRIADFSDGELSGRPIFLGYGLHAPQAGWDDFGEHDLRGRLVVAFTGAPPSVEAALSPAERYLLTDESKAAVAMTRGATSIVFINSPREHGDGTGQRPDRLREVRPAFALDGVAAARVTARAGRRVFGQMSLDLVEYQQRLDFGRPLSVEIPLEISGVLRLERTIVTADNVVGKLGDGAGPPIVLGAHYDHLGYGGPASLYKGPVKLHPGADDNASGVAAMLEVAARLRDIAPTRPVYFAALTGEERALRGSRTLARVFVDRRPDRDVVFVNLDMLGRLEGEKLRAFAEPSSPLVQVALDGATRAGISLDLRRVTDAHSDHVPFAELGYDAIGFSTGHHRDYHRPSDTPDRLDWRGLAQVTDFLTATIKLLATRE